MTWPFHFPFKIVIVTVSPESLLLELVIVYEKEFIKTGEVLNWYPLYQNKHGSVKKTQWNRKISRNSCVF